MLCLSLQKSIFLILVVTIGMVWLVIVTLFELRTLKDLNNFLSLLFPSAGNLSGLLLGSFIGLAFLNLLRLICYSFPVTTTLSFNLAAALALWLARVIIFFVKPSSASSLLPANTPWYLIPFLSLVEIISIIVRPITLCFRLLANMRAGHIILRLICKIPLIGTLSVGVLFGVLELIVSLVQAFVFFILITVYLEESLSH